MSPSGSNDRILLDTSAYAQLRRGHLAALDVVAHATAVLMPTIVLGELEAGFLMGSRVRENRKSLAEFLDEPGVIITPVTRDVSVQYGRLFALLKRQGSPIPTNDIWIAACTLASGAVLVTFDRHYDRIATLPRQVLAIR
jgi:tRNA(fMet)-specific endonuclease VapC